MMKKYNLVKTLIYIYIIYFMIFESASVKREITNAISLWINIIVPSVFPYLVISQYISDMNINLSDKNLLLKLLKISPCSIKAIICSFICGYPSGAICAKNLYEKKRISKKEAMHLICFTNNAGPLFLISAIGTSMLGSLKDGFALYIIQLLSAFLYGLFSRTDYKFLPSLSNLQTHIEVNLCDAIKKSVTTIINICGFMIAAYVMAECVTNVICKLNIPFVKSYSIYISAFIKSVFEISAGVSKIGNLCAPDSAFAFICAAVSWSGISVMMQIKSVAGDIFEAKKFLFAKFVQSIMSMFLGYGYKSLSDVGRFNFYGNYVMNLSLMISMLLFLFYILKQSANKKSSQKN